MYYFNLYKPKTEHRYIPNTHISFYQLVFTSSITIMSTYSIKVITKLPNSEQSYKGKVQTHNYINRQNQSTTGKLWKPQWRCPCCSSVQFSVLRFLFACPKCWPCVWIVHSWLPFRFSNVHWQYHTHKHLRKGYL
jgi:hypothetical protein